MAIRLATTLNKISFIPNATNLTIIKDLYEYMKANGTSENYQNQNLKAMIVFANLGPNTNFFDIKSRQQIIAFLDPRIKNTDVDPDKRWITTWNNNNRSRQRKTKPSYFQSID
jgi:hypothetical protein